MLNLNKWHCIGSPDKDKTVITPESLEYNNTSDKQKSSDLRTPGALGGLTIQTGAEQQSVRLVAPKTRGIKDRNYLNIDAIKATKLQHDF
jgi:hypothetical protein